MAKSGHLGKSRIMFVRRASLKRIVNAALWTLRLRRAAFSLDISQRKRAKPVFFG